MKYLALAGLLLLTACGGSLQSRDLIVYTADRDEQADAYKTIFEEIEADGYEYRDVLWVEIFHEKADPYSDPRRLRKKTKTYNYLLKPEKLSQYCKIRSKDDVGFEVDSSEIDIRVVRFEQENEQISIAMTADCVDNEYIKVRVGNYGGLYPQQLETIESLENMLAIIYGSENIETTNRE